MGAQESTEAHVSFNHPNSFYFAGEQVTGNISFYNTHGKLNFDEVYLEFIGELGYTTDETRYRTDNTGKSQPEHYTEHHQIPFMKIPISVVRPQTGEREVILNNGQYSWPFEFTLPTRLPPSTIPPTNLYPYVKYYARIVLNKPWYKPDTRQYYLLTIFPRVNLLHIPGSQQRVPFSDTNRRDVRLDGYLLRGGIVPNEQLPIYINLQNPKHSTIKRIEAVLIQHQQVAQKYHQEVIFRVDLPDIHEFNGATFERTVSLPLPPQLAPSYQFTAHFNQNTYPLIIKYEFLLKLKSHGLLTDFDVKMPLSIGTELPLDRQQNNSLMEMPVAGALASYYNEPPPNYEAIISNKKI